MQRRNPERRAQQEMRRIAQAEGADGRYASGPGAGFGGAVGVMDGDTWKPWGRVNITAVDAPFYVAVGTGDPGWAPGRVNITPVKDGPFYVDVGGE
jgi:hypothetical protein